MPQRDSTVTARLMIRRHGLQAQAVALEQAREMRLRGDAAGLDQWQSIHAAICELRRCGSPAMRSRPAENRGR